MFTPVLSVLVYSKTIPLFERRHWSLFPLKLKLVLEFDPLNNGVLPFNIKQALGEVQLFSRLSTVFSIPAISLALCIKVKKLLRG